MSLVAGVFVGGASSRMGGRPKGLLHAPDGRAIAARTVDLARAVASDVVLVGIDPAYASLAPAIADAAPKCGPLGGLVALLEYAGAREAIAVACDMPRLTPALFARLAEEHRGAAIVAPRMRDRGDRGDRWSPLFARYDAARVLAAARARLDAGQLALQPLFDAMAARELAIDDDERRALEDWDTPEDIDRT